MMAIGMRSIAVERMELPDHKVHKVPLGQMVCKVRLVHKDLPEQQDLPDRKVHKGDQGLMERLEHRDQQDRKDQRD